MKNMGHFYREVQIMGSLSFKEVLKKYFNRNKDYMISENILHEMNGIVLQKTDDSIFDFNGKMAEEVKSYCQEQGFDIEKIVFASSYDIEVEDSGEYNLKADCDSSIKIIEENGQIIASVCIGGYVKIKDIKYAK
jgi:hypothetical protein